MIVINNFPEGKETRMKAGDQGDPGPFRRVRVINRAFNLTTAVTPGN